MTALGGANHATHQLHFMLTSGVPVLGATIKPCSRSTIDPTIHNVKQHSIVPRTIKARKTTRAGSSSSTKTEILLP